MLRCRIERTVSEMARTLGAPRGMRSSRFTVDGTEYLVISYSLDEPDLGPSLTPAERDVALALVRGWSLERIARSRRTSPRTVANQAQGIYRALGVCSRLELAALLRNEAR